jgi:hypothetical protein
MRDACGQAIVEAPFVIIALCLMAILLFQPVVQLYTRMVLGQVAGELARVAAVDVEGGKVLQARYEAWAADKLRTLPAGTAFSIPGSLKVVVQGNARSERISVQLSVRQKALPFFSFLGKRGDKGTVTITGKAHAPGTLTQVSGSPSKAPQIYGFVETAGGK